MVVSDGALPLVPVIGHSPLGIGVLLVIFAHVASATPVNYTVAFGVGSDGTVVGNATSGLNAAIARIFPRTAPPSVVTSHAVLINASALSFLTLTGDYAADVPLALPPLFVLVLRGAMLRAVAPFSGAALVVANASKYAAIVAPGGPSTGALVCAGAGATPGGVLALNADFVVVDGVSVVGCGGDGGGTAAITVRGAPSVTGASVCGCAIVGGGGRGVWMEAASLPFVRDCALRGVGAHTLDVDAYSSRATVARNAVGDSAQEGVFLEQGARSALVAFNALGPNNSVGVAVYNFIAGAPTAPRASALGQRHRGQPRARRLRRRHRRGRARRQRVRPRQRVVRQRRRGLRCQRRAGGRVVCGQRRRRRRVAARGARVDASKRDCVRPERPRGCRADRRGWRGRGASRGHAQRHRRVGRRRRAVVVTARRRDRQHDVRAE